MATSGGSSIYPGTAGTAGTLAFNNSLNLSSGGAVYFDVSTSHSSGNDQITVGGSLTLSSSDAIHIDALSGASPLDQTADYVLFAGSSAPTMSSTPSLVFDGTAPANFANFSIKTSGNNVVLRYAAATAPQVSATVSPTSAVRNQSVTVNATVTPGSGTINYSTGVKVNLNSIGGSASQAMTDSGDHVHFSYAQAVAASTTVGSQTLTVTVTDSTPLSGSSALTLTVSASVEVWDGLAGNANWSSGANWVSTYAPGYAGDSLVFSNTVSLSPNMNNSYSVNGVSFDASAGSFTVGASGSTLTLAGAGGGVTNNSANPETLNVPITLSGAQTINAAAGNVTLGQTVNTAANALTVAGANNTTISGAISGGGSLTMNGAGTLDLGGAADTVGTVTVTGGTVQDGTVTGTGYAFQSGTVSANLAGNGAAATQTTSGATLLSGNNTYGGGTTISAGTLQLGSANALGTGSATIGAAGTLDLNGQSITNAIVTIISGAVLTNSSVTAATVSTGIGVSTNNQVGNFTIGAAGNITLSDVFVYQNYTLTKTGAGTLDLGGTNANSAGGNGFNLTINNGVVMLSKTGGGVAANTVTINSGATLLMDPTHTTLGGGAAGWSGQINGSVTRLEAPSI